MPADPLGMRRPEGPLRGDETPVMAENPATGAHIIQGAAPATYSLTARVLHWTTATLVLFMLPLGVIIAMKWEGPWKDWLYNLHRSIGAVIIPLIFLRLAYRATHRPPPMPDDMPPIQQFGAHAVHWGLYALLVIQPFIGWIASSAYPAPVPVFGLFELPPIWWPDRALSDSLVRVHALIAATIAGLLVMHIGAALYHHFVRRDGILTRMTGG
jgi:cytochrome b561